jgi:hypothetical protein
MLQRPEDSTGGSRLATPYSRCAGWQLSIVDLDAVDFAGTLMMEISVDSLKSAAAARSSLEDFGDDWFEQPLAAWVQDLAGPALSNSGRAFLTRLAITNLCRRLEVVDCLKRNPEIADVPIPPILYITGLERSGTTLLHNLLALHPGARALLRWELTRPAPPPERDTFRTDPRIAEVQASLEPLRGTRLEQMHWVDAVDPEECTWGAYDCTGLLGRATGVLMPTWDRWILDHDMTASFREYRLLIKLLTWRNPVQHHGHLVLKCPQNARHIGAFASVFPEAKFVVTHRDPYRTIVSVCALTEHINSAFTRDDSLYAPDGPGVRWAIGATERSLSRITGFARESRACLMHAHYPGLVAAPADVVRSIYEQAGMDEPMDLQQGFHAFIEAQTRGKRAKPPAELPTYGLERTEFADRPIVAAYCRQFGVMPEMRRITGT